MTSKGKFAQNFSSLFLKSSNKLTMQEKDERREVSTFPFIGHVV